MVQFRLIDDTVLTVALILADLKGFDAESVEAVEFTQDTEEKEARLYHASLHLGKDVEVIRIGGNGVRRLPINSKETKAYYGNDPAINKALDTVINATKALTALINPKWKHTAKCYIRRKSTPKGKSTK